MNNIQLPKHFFDENPLIEFSTAMFTHFLMVTIKTSGFDEQVNKLTISAMEKPRHEQYLAEKEYLTNLNKPEDIVSYMRKIKEPLNRELLIKKAIEYQDDVMPLV